MELKMNYNYHAHTKYCHHADGEIEDYIKRAIDNGILYMGFSDHIPFKFPDGFEAGYRVLEADVDKYYSKIDELRKKYKDRIDIKIGFEMEYYPKSFKKMLDNAIKFGGEYLILGQHLIDEEHFGGVPSGENITKEQLGEYVSRIIEGMKSGAFTYVAHPDIVGYTEDEKIYADEIRKICVASKECDIPLEINFLGIRAKRRYPNPAFWKIAGEEKAPVTFGFDAHSAKDAYDGNSLIKAEKIVKKYKLNYIERPKLIKIGRK